MVFPLQVVSFPRSSPLRDRRGELIFFAPFGPEEPIVQNERDGDRVSIMEEADCAKAIPKIEGSTFGTQPDWIGGAGSGASEVKFGACT